MAAESVKTIRIAAAQTPEFRQNIEAALQHLHEVAAKAERENVKLICFPEGYLQGYLTEECSARHSALNLASSDFKALLARFPKTGAVIVLGLIEIDRERLFNTAVVVKDGVALGRYRKTHLLAREAIFEAGTESPVFNVDGLRFGINICNDTNFPQAAQKLADMGASLIVCPANNMYRIQSAIALKDVHNAVRRERCRETGLWLISADVTGEREGKVAWGPTALLNPAGEIVAQLALEQPGLLVADLPYGN